MKRNKAKTKNNFMRKKGSKNFEANQRNACETDLCSLRFALKRKQIISENRTPYSKPASFFVTWR